MDQTPDGNSPVRESAVDRLIHLARKEKVPAKTSVQLALEDSGETRPPMWRALLQLRVLLPYVGRLLPLIDGSSASPGSQEFRHGIGEVLTSHRDLRLQMQDHAIQLKRVEDQLTRLRETSERSDFERAEHAEEVRSVRRLLRILFGAVAGLLVILVAMVGMLLLHARP